jgi:CBS domain containing-hemolysin-like protein
MAFVCAGGLFAAADAVVTALPEARLRALLESFPRGRRTSLRRVLRDRHGALARFLVGRVVCIVVAAVLATQAFTRLWPRWGGFLAAVLVSAAYGTLTAIATTIVRRRPMALAHPLLKLVRPFEMAMIPVAAPFAMLGRLVGAVGTRRTPLDPAESARIAEREVGYLIQHGQASGVLGHGELLQAALDFREKTAADVMIPRTRMVAVEFSTPLARVLELIIAEGHSRYPVFEGRIDEVVGLLYVKDLFRAVREGPLESKTLASLVRRPVLFVQENQGVSDILREMRARRLHMAIVVDEFGGTAGIVTLEDVLELLVGDIQDELDEEDPVQELGDGRFLVDAALSVDELAHRMGVALPERTNFVSVGGLLMEQLGKVPSAGATVKIGPLAMVVREADERRVRRVEVSRLLDAHDGAEEEV